MISWPECVLESRHWMFQLWNAGGEQQQHVPSPFGTCSNLVYDYDYALSQSVSQPRLDFAVADMSASELLACLLRPDATCLPAFSL
jgi:hypothetical protein